MSKTTAQKSEFEHDYDTSSEKKAMAIKLTKAAKLNLITTNPFYSIMLSNLNEKYVNISTLGTDGSSLYIDPQFVCGADPEFIEAKKKMFDEFEGLGVLTPEECAEKKRFVEVWFKKKSVEELSIILCHEVRHILEATFERQGYSENNLYDHQLFNQASDHAINLHILYDFQKGVSERDREEFIKKAPMFEFACMDIKYASINDGKLKVMEPEEIYLDLLKNKEKSKGDSFDVHMEISKETEATLRTIITQAAGVAESYGRGSTPSDVKALVDHWTKPKIKWSTLFDRDIKNNIIYDYDYSKPSSRSWALTNDLRKKGYLGKKQFVITPTTTTEDTIEAMLVFDSSGSIYASPTTLSEILGEAAGIIKEFKNARLHVCCFDTEVHNYQVFDNANIEDLKKYDIVGGGGSSLTCVGELIEEKKLPLTSMAVFSDLEVSCDWDLFKNVRNSIFVVFNSEIKAPIGRTLIYEDF